MEEFSYPEAICASLYWMAIKLRLWAGRTASYRVLFGGKPYGDLDCCN